MPKFRATVQLVGLEGVDSAEVRRAFEARLAKGGFEKWHVVSIERQGGERRVEAPPRIPVRPARRQANPPPQINLGGVLLVAAAVWVVWLFLALTE